MVMTQNIEDKSKKGKNKAIDSHNEFPPGMAPKLLSMLETIEKLEESLDPLVSKPHHEVLAKMTPLEKSKLGMLEAYTINSLFWVLMKTSKDDVESNLFDDYKIEMGRLKEIQGRIVELEAREERPQVNTAIAARLIRRSIGHKKKKNVQNARNAKKLKREEKPEDCEDVSFKPAWQ